MQIFLSILLLLVGFVVLVKGADIFVDGRMRSSLRIVSSSVDVSCVTASKSGLVPSSLVSPRSAASIIALVPAACRFTMSTSSSDKTAMAFPTVFGMS